MWCKEGLNNFITACKLIFFLDILIKISTWQHHGTMNKKKKSSAQIFFCFCMQMLVEPKTTIPYSVSPLPFYHLFYSRNGTFSIRNQFRKSGNFNANFMRVSFLSHLRDFLSNQLKQCSKHKM